MMAARTLSSSLAQWTSGSRMSVYLPMLPAEPPDGDKRTPPRAGDATVYTTRGRDCLQRLERSRRSPAPQGRRRPPARIVARCELGAVSNGPGGCATCTEGCPAPFLDIYAAMGLVPGEKSGRVLSTEEDPANACYSFHGHLRNGRCTAPDHGPIVVVLLQQIYRLALAPTGACSTYCCLTMSTDISTAGVVPLFSSQCSVLLSSGQPTPGP
jgi:hypothetical protein